MKGISAMLSSKKTTQKVKLRVGGQDFDRFLFLL